MYHQGRWKQFNCGEAQKGMHQSIRILPVWWRK